MFHMALFPCTGRSLELHVFVVCLTKGLFIHTALFPYAHSSLFIYTPLFSYVYIALFSYTYIALFSLINKSLALIYQEKNILVHLTQGLYIHFFIFVSLSFIYTYMSLFIYRSLLQNMVSFTGLFCKRDLYFEGASIHSHPIVLWSSLIFLFASHRACTYISNSLSIYA